MKLPDIPELKQFTVEQLKPVWWCYGDIEGIKRTFLDKDDNEIEDIAGDYLDDIYEAYKGEYTDTKKILTPEEFDFIYEKLINAPQPLVFVERK